MSFDQVRALAVAVLFLASVVTVLWGAEIAGAASGAWERGTAQAAAERRHLSRAAAGARDANSAGRGLSGAFRRAAAAARGMRGAAGGASAWARKENGPARRVIGATATGARLGWTRTARAAAAARRRTAAGRGATSRPGRRPGDASRPGGARGARRRGPLGVCDKCGVTVARRNLHPVKGPGGLEALLCLLCRRRGGFSAQASRSPQPPRQQGAPSLVPATGAPGVPVAAAAGHDGAALPAGTLAAARAAAFTPGTATAAPSLPAGQGAHSMAAGRTPAALGNRRTGTALATRARSAVAGRGAPVGELPAGDSTTHGEWERNVTAVLVSLARLYRHAKLMADTMTAKDGAENLIADVSAWADHIYAAGQRILSDLLAIDAKIGPYVQAVMDAGGPLQVASPEWHEDY